MIFKITKDGVKTSTSFSTLNDTIIPKGYRLLKTIE